MRWNNRKSPRVRFEHKPPATLMGVDGTWRRSCLLLDISETGAKLEIDGPTNVLQAKEFFLVLSSTGLAFRRCQLVWIEGSQAGVHFISKASFGKQKTASMRDG